MIILQLMVKNESRIITRCIESAINIVDAVYILDTGSTDATKEVAEKTLIDSGKPFKIESSPFINFGETRSLSFEKCREFIDELGWDRKNTYCLLLDGDMVLKPSEEFKSFPLVSKGYKIIQNNQSLEYFNIRLLNAEVNWKCIGSTHEYWSAEGIIPNINKCIISIEDVNDGGSKSDKFSRDARLLEEDLSKNPDNPRTVFYLAQTYKDLDRHIDSIRAYKCRIGMVGWVEEVWYSHYMIGMLYEKLGEFDKMELWLNKAFINNPNRAESLYNLVRYNRVVGNYYKAYHYYLLGKSIPYPKNDILFIDHHVYTYLFDYEYSILAYYVNREDTVNNLKHIISYINNSKNIKNSFDNIIHYIQPLGNERSYCFPVLCLDDVYNTSNKIKYNPSSTSIIKYNNKWIMNIRYVNFTPLNNGSYTHDGDYVNTVNVLKFVDDIYSFDSSNSNINILNEVDMFKDSKLRVQGYEDVRLFEFNGMLMFSATLWNKQPMVCYGKYDISNNILTDTKILQPPSPTTCEKNWLFLSHSGELKVIYKWYPMQICKIDNDTLTVINEYPMPEFFSGARGSSNPFYYNDSYWCLLHGVRYSTPRIYYHYIVKLNKDTLRPEKYSLPFYFVKPQIEYSIGFDIKDDRCIFIFSQNDSNTSTLEKKVSEFTWLDAI